MSNVFSATTSPINTCSSPVRVALEVCGRLPRTVLRTGARLLSSYHLLILPGFVVDGNVVVFRYPTPKTGRQVDTPGKDA